VIDRVEKFAFVNTAHGKVTALSTENLLT